MRDFSLSLCCIANETSSLFRAPDRDFVTMDTRNGLCACVQSSLRRDMLTRKGPTLPFVMPRLAFIPLLVCCIALAMTAAPVSLFEIRAPRGLDFVLQNSPTPQKYLIETMPGGVALFDYNNDGLLDIFLVNGGHVTSPMRQPESFDRQKSAVLESPVPAEQRRQFYRRHGKSRIGQCWRRQLRHGSGGRRLRQ